MTTTDYNGWTNRSTWNVALWFNNDEGLYRLTTGPLGTRRWEPDEVQALVEETWPNGATPDGDELAEVDWEEIANAWSEE